MATKKDEVIAEEVVEETTAPAAEETPVEEPKKAPAKAVKAEPVVEKISPTKEAVKRAQAQKLSEVSPTARAYAAAARANDNPNSRTVQARRAAGLK